MSSTQTLLLCDQCYVIIESDGDTSQDCPRCGLTRLNPAQNLYTGPRESGNTITAEEAEIYLG